MLERIVIRLINLFDDRVNDSIYARVDQIPTTDWEPVYGLRFVYRTKHIIHGNNPT